MSRHRAAFVLTATLGALSAPIVAQQEPDADGWQAVGSSPARSSVSTASDGTVGAPPSGKGWQAIGATPDTSSASPSFGGARGGDRLWVAREGDSLADIARAATGSADGAGRIGAYNALGDGAALAPGQLLYIPGDLAPSGQAASAEPEIREFGENEGGAGAPRGEAPRVTRSDADLFVGEVRVFGRFDVSRVAIGNGAIVRAEVLDTGELLVIAQSPGSTSLRLWNKDGTQSDFNIRVSESDPETRVRMERMVRMRVRLIEFKRSALGRLGIRWADSASGPTLGIAGDAIGNDLFRGEGGIEGLPNVVRPFSTYFGVATEITSRINLLASNGDAITLAEPVLSTTNGGSASFLAGGEVPYPSTGVNGQTIVQFKEYGIKLNISPLVDAGGNVRTAVETEISSLDPSVSVEGAPGLLTRRAQTEVNVRSGETIVISGLLSSESSKDVERVPGIGRLPIIGRFFRSRNTREAVSELVIFVTPEVIDPSGALTLSSREQRYLDESTTRLEDARDRLPLMD